MVSVARTTTAPTRLRRAVQSWRGRTSTIRGAMMFSAWSKGVSWDGVYVSGARSWYRPAVSEHSYWPVTHQGGDVLLGLAGESHSAIRRNVGAGGTHRPMPWLRSPGPPATHVHSHRVTVQPGRRPPANTERSAGSSWPAGAGVVTRSGGVPPCRMLTSTKTTSPSK